MEKKFYRIQVQVATDRDRVWVEQMLIKICVKMGMTVRGIRFLPIHPKGRGKPIGLRRIAEITLHAQPQREFIVDEIAAITGQSVANTRRSLNRSLKEGSVIYVEGEDVWKANTEWTPPVEDGVE